jgi:hypothetical protein
VETLPDGTLPTPPTPRQPLVRGVGLEYTTWQALCLRCSGIRQKP